MATAGDPLRVLLGSSSKWRAALVGRALPPGGRFVLIPGGFAPDIDEKALGDRSPGADARELVQTIAQAKADALVPVLQSGRADLPTADLVITADQVIVHDGVIREKPVDEAQAKAFMQSYGTTGLPAECVTGVVVANLSTGQRCSGVDVAKQWFESIPDGVALAVIAKGDVMGCAGSFVVEEPLLAPFIGKREGEMESVEGMPIALTTRLLLEAAGEQ